jgi:hypothetical protein
VSCGPGDGGGGPPSLQAVAAARRGSEAAALCCPSWPRPNGATGLRVLGAYGGCTRRLNGHLATLACRRSARRSAPELPDPASTRCSARRQRCASNTSWLHRAVLPGAWLVRGRSATPRALYRSTATDLVVRPSRDDVLNWEPKAPRDSRR